MAQRRSPSDLHSVRKNRREKIRRVLESWSDLTPTVNIVNEIHQVKKESDPSSLRVPKKYRTITILVVKVLGAIIGAGSLAAGMKEAIPMILAWLQ